MVPQFRPQAALHFIEKFVTGETLSPLMPLNTTLADMSDDSFHKAFAAWTESAMTAPYVSKEAKGSLRDSESKTAIE
jgi:hypothetical protein